jgi:3-hydroxy-9,10-secoandrosta-1,3,5(10)-triene-9,17-dione monooxygenase reductase component
MTREQAALAPVDEQAFRNTLGRFATGVAVVTAVHAGERVGMAVNSFTAVSLSPPLMLFCAAHTSRTWPRIREAGVFGVSILGEGQGRLCRQFAARHQDRFAGVDTVTGTTGAPLIRGAIAHVEGQIVDVHEGGDHDVVLGEAITLGSREGRPLVFFGGQLDTIAS